MPACTLSSLALQGIFEFMGGGPSVVPVSPGLGTLSLLPTPTSGPVAHPGLRCLGLPQLHKVLWGPAAPGPSTPDLGLGAWVGLLGTLFQCGGARLGE